MRYYIELKHGRRDRVHGVVTRLNDTISFFCVVIGVDVLVTIRCGDSNRAAAVFMCTQKMRHNDKAKTQLPDGEERKTTTALFQPPTRSSSAIDAPRLLNLSPHYRIQ